MKKRARLLPIAVIAIGALLGHAAAMGWPGVVPARAHHDPAPADDRGAPDRPDRTTLPIPEPQPPTIT